MSHPLPRGPRHSLRDYLSWDDDRRYGLIDGEAYLMAPAPSLVDQAITLGLAGQLRNRMDEKGRASMSCPCRVFVAPMDIVLGPATAGQTDVVLVCDPAKLADGRNMEGTADLALEVLSVATARRGRRVKRDLHERVGVVHYWLADPDALTVECYRREGVPMVNRRSTVPVTASICPFAGASSSISPRSSVHPQPPALT